MDHAKLDSGQFPETEFVLRKGYQERVIHCHGECHQII